MSNTPNKFKNPELYTAYLNLLNNVVTSYQSLFREIYLLKKSRETLAYDPYLKSRKAFLTEVDDLEGLEVLYTKDDILMQRIVSFLIDGLFPEISVTKEYSECVRVMDTDLTTKNQVNKTLLFLGTVNTKRHWTYLSHFLENDFEVF